MKICFGCYKLRPAANIGKSLAGDALAADDVLSYNHVVFD